MALVAGGFLGSLYMSAQNVEEADLLRIQQVVASHVPQNTSVGKVKVGHVSMNNDTVHIDLSGNFGEIPFTESSIEALKTQLLATLGSQYKGNSLKLTIAGNDIDSYWVDFDKSYKRKHAPFITPVDKNYRYSKALDGNIVALWPSHGLYFENSLNRWEWQRGRLLQTVEDLYTHSYVIPYLMPMLENAGAYVWDARERDTHNFAVIVDNDGGKAMTGYHEKNGKNAWQKGESSGFALNRDQYVDWQNPFNEGSYRKVSTTKEAKRASIATWDVDMPQAGDYAIYISYKSVEGSAKDARYTVNSLAGSQEFLVDQNMAGGVWVYLGTFQLAKGLNKNVVTLSNLSKQENAVVTADAIKVGGGLGCVARRPAERTPENLKLAQEGKHMDCLAKEGVTYDYVTSGNYPWYKIASRYYLQWAGFPATVYSPSQGLVDYNDDYRSRGLWVNYLAGGSSVNPAQQGLKVPVDVSFCLHTDAGVTKNDDIVGTLLIYSTQKNGKLFGKYEDGTPREISRSYADIVMSQVVNDIRAKYEPNWTRRGMRDASYYEARVPEVPALLMELLSHQNLADMKYGQDPNFRFDVSRAIYKGILKFIAKRDHRDYVVQPLPVNSFNIGKVSDGCYVLSWKPTPDALSENADAKKYVVMERVASGGFKEIAIVNKPQYVTYVDDNLVHSYKIVAMNEGGRSFPSEVLSLGVAKNSKGNVAVVNGFTRLSAPDWFEHGDYAGFDDAADHGVDYVQQLNYVGPQVEFNRNLDWVDDDNTGFGDSRASHETQTIAGNTFDYTAIHGESIIKAGYSFVSTSLQAFSDGMVSASDFAVLDLAMGKQKECMNGRGAYPSRYKIFTPQFMGAVKNFTAGGGSVLMTGSYVGSDIWNKPKTEQAESHFAETVMGYRLRASRASQNGQVVTVANNCQVAAGLKFDFHSALNSDFYAVESPDALYPADERGMTVMRYGENAKPAAVASKRDGYRTVVAGFPFETVKQATARDTLMGQMLDFLVTK